MALSILLRETLSLNVGCSKKDYSSWLLKFHIDLAPLTIVHPSMINILLVTHSLFTSVQGYERKQML